jgi:hypothetical protein
MRGRMFTCLFIVVTAYVCRPAIGFCERPPGDGYRVFPSVLAPCGGLVCRDHQYDLLFTCSESVAGESRNDTLSLWSGFRYERRVTVICPDVTGVQSDLVGPLASSALLLPVPTPARGPVRIVYQVQRAGQVRFAVHDIQGRLIHQMVQQVQMPGQYEITWDGTAEDGRPVSTGVYFIWYSTGDTHDAGRIVLIR